MKFTIRRNVTEEELFLYSNLRESKESDHFIAESEKIVIRLLRSELEILSLYLTQEHFDSKKDLIEGGYEGIFFFGSLRTFSSIII